MKKRKLYAIERPKATPEMVEKARELNDIKYIAEPKLIDKTILVMNFFSISDLKEGSTAAKFRTFLSKDDYITQDLTKDNTKWITASFDMMQEIGFYRTIWDKQKKEYRDNFSVYTWSGQDVIETFFKSYKKYESDTIWNLIRRFQNEVKERRLEQKHRKVLDPIDLKMEHIQDPPQEFKDWVWEHGMSFSRYGIYKETEKGKAEFECSYCKAKGIVDRTQIRLRNNEKGECPFCKSKVTYKAKGKLARVIKDTSDFIYVDRQEKGFLLRYFWASREIRDGKIKEGYIKETSFEYKRCFWTVEKKSLRKEAYEWGVYHQRGNCRWIPDSGSMISAGLYPDNLPEAWEHTAMKYSGIDILAKNYDGILPYEGAIPIYLEFPKLEWICKMGLNNLAANIVNKYSFYYISTDVIDYKANTIYEILGLTKVNTKILQEIDGNTDELDLLREAQKLNIQMSAEQVKEYYEVFGCNIQLLREKRNKISFHKFFKYFDKEIEKYMDGKSKDKLKRKELIELKRNMARDWLDYLDWCRELKYNLDNMFIYMPNNFKQVHDRVAKEYKELKDRKAAAEKKRRDKLIAKKMQKLKKDMEEIFSKNAGVDALNIKGNGLILIVPANSAAIKEEGEALHHCVGTYIERVAKGETAIFFIRKENEPNKPYYTLEWRDNKVIQCRGMNNCSVTDKVKAFVKTFEEKMNEQIKAKESA
jgi:hypothetical protein